MLSVQLAERATAAGLPEDAWLRDLALHLMAAHHGYGRPFAPIVLDENPPAVLVDLRAAETRIASALDANWRRQHPPHRLDSGIADRFWRLVRRHGWWGLAYFEAIVRLADQLASMREDEAMDELTTGTTGGVTP